MPANSKPNRKSNATLLTQDIKLEEIKETADEEHEDEMSTFTVENEMLETIQSDDERGMKRSKSTAVVTLRPKGEKERFNYVEKPKTKEVQPRPKSKNPIGRSRSTIGARSDDGVSVAQASSIRDIKLYDFEDMISQTHLASLETPLITPQSENNLKTHFDLTLG